MPRDSRKKRKEKKDRESVLKAKVRCKVKPES